MADATFLTSAVVPCLLPPEGNRRIGSPQHFEFLSVMSQARWTEPITPIELSACCLVTEFNNAETPSFKVLAPRRTDNRQPPERTRKSNHTKTKGSSCKKFNLKFHVGPIMMREGQDQADKDNLASCPVPTYARFTSRSHLIPEIKPDDHTTTLTFEPVKLQEREKGKSMATSRAIVDSVW
ncbi:hypothetical protein BJX63DRAFT_334639 [Aspergillus granulosus]|uniref:Uncharacterized protein n=1 Tax=Aspergillus granulosus TaxID=176169 RepID=A0ABR4HWX2_9EURO